MNILFALILLASSATNPTAPAAYHADEPAPAVEGSVYDTPPAESPAEVEMGPPQNVAPVAAGQASVGHTWIPEPAPVPPPAPNVYRHKIGVQLGLGVPDAATLGVVFRPVKFVRLELGGAYNYLTEGVQVGVTALPFGRVLSFTGECGYFFGGNANKFTNKEYPALDDMSYEYCNTHAGLDFGRERATFFIHGGMSYFDARIRNVTQQINRSDVTVVSDPHLTAWFPSFKLGLIVYFGK